MIARSTIRQNLRDNIAALGYVESPNHWEAFGRNSQNRSDKMFVIGFGSTTETGGRQSAKTGIAIASTVSVMVAFIVKPHTAVASYDDALDGIEAIIQSVINPSIPLYTNTQIRFSSSSITLTDIGEWQMAKIDFQITNHLPL